jgi:hypothetical protein
MVIKEINIIIVTIDGVFDWTFDLLTITTRNYIHLLRHKRAPHFTDYAKFFQRADIFIIRFLVTVSNDSYYSASVLKSSLNNGCIPAAHFCFNCPAYSPFGRTR